MDLTPQALSEAKFRGPVRFYDGAGGMARQDFECIDNPRFGYYWRRENRKDHGRQSYTVDGADVADLAEACAKLAVDAAPDSPDQLLKRSVDEFRQSPKVGGATRALSEARCNADTAPFSMTRAWMKRADHSWHVGINAYSDDERKAGREWPSWLYAAKEAAHESYRAIYLFAADRDKDTDLQCALGKRCRDCPILQQIERSMVASRARERFPSEVEDCDIDAAKAWTCITHAMTSGQRPHDGMFLSCKNDRRAF